MNYAQNVPGGGILAIVFFVTSKLYYQISIKRGIRFYIQVALSAFYAVILNFGIQLDLLSTIQLNGITLLSLLFLMIEIFPFIVCMMESFDKKKMVGKKLFCYNSFCLDNGIFGTVSRGLCNRCTILVS